MIENKLRGILKSKIFACIVTGIVLFNIGGIISISAKDDVEKELTQAKDEITKLENENKELKDKVAQAEPWFNMKEEERKAQEEQNKKAEEERKAKQQAEEEQNKKAEEERKAKLQAEEEAKKQQELEAKSVTLGNGNYTSGEDFTPGTYTITAISGGGNVISSNPFNGGINAIMGTANDGFYHKEYKNIKLPEGTTLKVDSVTVKLTPKE